MAGTAPFFGESSYYRGRGSYANPHGTIAQRDIPTSLRQVMRLCGWYYNTDSILGAIIDKMSEYPITDLIIKARQDVTLSSRAREKWEYLLNGVMDVRARMRSINVGKFVYGNHFSLLHLPFVRMGTCTSCDKTVPFSAIEDLKARPSAMGKRKAFTLMATGYCPSCKAGREFTVKDRPSRASAELSLVPLNPIHMELEYGVTSGRRDWYWTPPDSVRDGLMAGSRVVLETTDMTILAAAFAGHRILMNKDRLWVAQTPPIPGLFEGWGVPPLFKCLEDVYYYKILRRANEALAHEHVMPLRILSPGMAGDIPAQRALNLADWQSKLRTELQKFKTDPNHLLISPVPINVEQMGGNARVMMVAAEIEAAARIVSTGLGCPIEFIWGGLNWTGATVSLRVLENRFLNERADSERLLKFLIPQLAKQYQLPLVDVCLSDFKMADDVQRMSQEINMMLQGFLSRETVLAGMGIDHKEEFRKLESEHEEQNRITLKDQADAAHMQTLVKSLEAKAEILLQYELELERQRAASRIERAKLEDLNQFAQQLHQQGIVSPVELEQSSVMLSRLPPGAQQSVLANWSMSMPLITQMLLLRVQSPTSSAMLNSGAMDPNAAMAGAAGATDVGAAGGPEMPAPAGPYNQDGGAGPELTDGGAPLPEQRPPRR